MKTKMEPRVAPKVQRKMVLIYTGVGIVLTGVVALILFFYLNIGNQEVAYANNKTFTSITSGDWNVATTWQGGEIPPISGLNRDEVIINHDVNYTGNIMVDNQVNVTINAGASLTIVGDLIVNNNLTLVINGDLIIDGNLVAKNGAGVTINGGGTATVTQDATFSNNTVLVVDGILEITGDLVFGSNPTFTGSGVASLGLSGCSSWTGTSGNCVDNITLPIELLSFSAKREGQEVIIKWQTSQEINNDFFNIERSSNGNEFEQIAMIEGSGTSHTVLSYEYVDKFPLNGLSYYRLRQTDYDGTTEAFDMHSVAASTLMTNNIKIFPNPLLGSTLKMVIDQPEEGNIVILDENGQEVFSQEISNYYREQEMNLPENLKSGIYFVNVTTASVQKTFKLSKR